MSASGTEKRGITRGAITGAQERSRAAWFNATVVSGITTLIALAIFRANPHWDMAVSQWFFETAPCVTNAAPERSCGRFPIAEQTFWQGLREFGLSVPRLLMLMMLVSVPAIFVFNRTPDENHLRTISIGLVALFIGPLLITNWILKEFWGRARPFQTLDFGGAEAFSLPGTITDACARNCSFVSGESAAAFWMLWLVPLLPLAWRWKAGLLLLSFALFVAGLRVAFGRHFLSDVTIAAGISITAICFAYWFASTPMANRWRTRFMALGQRLAKSAHRSPSARL